MAAAIVTVLTETALVAQFLYDLRGAGVLADGHLHAARCWLSACCWSGCWRLVRRTAAPVLVLGGAAVVVYFASAAALGAVGREEVRLRGPRSATRSRGAVRRTKSYGGRQRRPAAPARPLRRASCVSHVPRCVSARPGRGAVGLVAVAAARRIVEHTLPDRTTGRRFHRTPSQPCRLESQR